MSRHRLPPCCVALSELWRCGHGQVERLRNDVDGRLVVHHVTPTKPIRSLIFLLLTPFRPNRAHHAWGNVDRRSHLIVPRVAIRFVDDGFLILRVMEHRQLVVERLPPRSSNLQAAMW